MIAARRFTLISLIILLAGCSATTLRDVWQAPEFSRKEFNDVLVVSLTADPTKRMVYEDEYVIKLAQKGVSAKASYKYLGLEVPKRDQIIDFARKEKFDYFLVSYLANETVDKAYIPPTITEYVAGGYPYGVYPGYYYPYFNSFWGPGAGASISTIVTPGYIDQTVDYIMVTSIYGVKDLQILWTGRTDTFEGASQPASYIAEEVANQVYDNIKDN